MNFLTKRQVGSILWTGLIAFVAFIGFSGSAAASPTILYVDGNDANCSDLGQGTSTQPFCSVKRAAAVAVAGQTVQVASGTYTAQATVSNSGTSGSPIVFTAAPGASVVLTGDRNGFSLSSKSNIVISGFTVTRTTSYGIAVSGGTNVTITGNDVSFSGKPVSSQTASGIFLSGVTNSFVTDNTSHDNSDHGIYLAGTTTGVTVQGNVAYRNAEQWQRNANGINVVAPGNSIIGNITHDNEDSGINIYPGANNSLVAHNLTYNNGDHGIDDLNVTGGRIVGNTVYRNCTTGINVEGTSGNYTVFNNIAVDNAVFVVNPTPLQVTNNCNRRHGNIGIWDSATGSTTVDYNIAYLTVSGAMYAWGTNYSSLTAFQAASGQGQHDLQANPLFASITAGDFHLQAGSPGIDSANAGASGEQASDLAGNPRVDDAATVDSGVGPRAYDDRGAYEFQPSSSPPPDPTAPTASLDVTPTSGTAPLSVTADASGSTPGTNPIASYTFDFGDGTVAGPQASASAGHTFTVDGTYTVRVTVADTAGLTASASQTVTVSASPPPPGGNLVGNSGFETDLTGWRGYATSSIARVTAGHSGSWAAELQNAGGGAADCGLNDSPNWIATTQAGSYTATVWVRADSPGATVKFKLTEYSGATKLGSASVTATLTADWQQITLAYTVSQPGSTLDFNLYEGLAGPGQCFQADDVAMVLSQ